MDRLTIPDVKLDNNVIQKSVITKQEVQNIAMEIYWRLKDIEDIIANEESEEYDLARLKELVMADRDGKVWIGRCLECDHYEGLDVCEHLGGYCGTEWICGWFEPKEEATHDLGGCHRRDE